MGKSLKGKELGSGLSQRKDGRYQAKYYIPGSPKPKYLYDRNLAKLKKKRDLEKAKYILGYNDKAKKYKVSEWFDVWMKLYKIGRIKANTVRGYVDGFERGADFIGSVRLDCLTPSHIYNMVEGMQSDGYAESSVVHTLSIVKQLLQSAVDNQMIPMNPCKGIAIEKSEKVTVDPILEDESKILQPEEIKTFLDAAKNTRYYELFYIILNTGMRIGEITALCWSDIDFECHRIRVYKTLNRTTIYFDEGKNRLEKPESVKQITTPKKKASYRWIPMTEGVELAFHSWEKKQIADKEKSGSSWGKENPFLKDFPDLVFTTQPGGVFLPQYANAECSRIISIIEKKEIELAEKENMLIGGILSFGRLGKKEDAPFVIKSAVIMTRYPGAEPAEVERLVTEPISREIQSMSGVYKIKSESMYGLSKITFELQPSLSAASIPQKWDLLFF